MSCVVVFGIFDGVHEGHRALFQQARELAAKLFEARLQTRRSRASNIELIVIVGRDEICKQLKGKSPRFSQEERIKLVAAEPFVDKAVLGDEQLSTYGVLEALDPDVVCLGYDQQELYHDLSSWVKANSKDIKLVVAKAYKPETYKNSLLNDS